MPRLFINSLMLFNVFVSAFVGVEASSRTPKVALISIHGPGQLGLVLAIFTVASRRIYMGGYSFFRVLVSRFGFLRRSFSQNDGWLKDGRGRAYACCDRVVWILDEKSLAFESFALDRRE